MKNNTISFSLHTGHEAETNIKFRVTMAGICKNQSHAGLWGSGLEGKSDDTRRSLGVSDSELWSFRVMPAQTIFI